MRMQTSRKIHYESGPNMTPLVDVVMVILIFMMLAGSFGGMERYLISNIPISRNGAGRVNKNAFEDVTLDVRVDALADNPDTWVAKFGDVRTGSPAQLTEAMKKKLDEYTHNGTDLKHLLVIINPNRLVKWKSLIAVYQSALEAGYGRISFNQSH
jgi:biopolymer transport protein ExbD